MRSYKIALFTAYLSLICLEMTAQRNESFLDNIKTLKTQVNGKWELLPIIILGSDDKIEISFDEMSHEYHRFTISIVHCNAEWEESGLFEPDYLHGFNERPITKFENSLNTTFSYTHYNYVFPNEDLDFKISGNYKAYINDESGETLRAAVTCFSVAEQAVSITAEVTGNTVLDINDRHQQVDFSINYNNLNIDNPDRQIIVRVSQNRRSDITVSELSPTHTSPGILKYTNNRKLTFPAGGEFRRFEIINMYDHSQNIDRIDFFAPYFHAILLKDKPRKNYFFDKDHNGRFIIRYSLATNSDIEADYLFAHFTLESEQREDGSVFISGDFTGNSLSSEWKMSYNDQNRCYEKTILIKQGSYDYQYLWVPEKSKTGLTSMFEGDFFETGNEYLIMVYYRQSGARYDRLVGYHDIRTSTN